MKNLRYVDSNWYKTTEGDTCLQQLQNQMHRSRKQFGLLERPNFPPGTLEMSYKINVIGKAGTGKTKIISMISTGQQRSTTKLPYLKFNFGRVVNIFPENIA